ncbi:hypothetical protein GCM10010307_26380 [Streptomyces vastus]|uniref:Uncharacterized protein n=1 Tax=Streptomyces vastus TaxID=285451 RepID=A0ABP6D561_9ACTN
MQAVRKRDHKEKPPREPLVWPRALRECVAEDEHFRNTSQSPVVDDGLDDLDWHRRRQRSAAEREKPGCPDRTADERRGIAE